MQAQEIWLDNKRYLLLGGQSIVPENWRGEESYAYLTEEGEVMRHHQLIAHWRDLRFGEMVEIKITTELLTTLLHTLFGADENDNSD